MKLQMNIEELKKENKSLRKEKEVLVALFKINFLVLLPYIILIRMLC